MQQIQYFKSAWGDIKNSPGWFGKLCLLALVNFIPVFGQIVTMGYLYGWAREIAWGTHEPMPAHIFGNEDGKLYRRGWFILVLGFVVALVSSIVMNIGESMQGVGVWGIASGSHATGNAILSGFGLLIYLVGLVGGFLLMILAWIGYIRISIYDRLSAGFQFGKIWKMFRHDTNGIMRIFGMYLLFSVIIGLILSIIIFIFVFFVVLAGVAGMAASGYDLHTMQHMSETQAYAVMLQSFASAGIVGILGIIIVTFLAFVGTLFVSLLVARAMGYWAMQFDIPNWRGQDDPMPFEIAGAAMGTQAAGPVTPPPAQTYGNYSQPTQQQWYGTTPGQAPAQQQWNGTGTEQMPAQQPWPMPGPGQEPVQPQWNDAATGQIPNQQPTAPYVAPTTPLQPVEPETPAMTQPVEPVTSAESQPVETVAPAETHPVDLATPAETQPVETITPSETQPVETVVPAETQPVEPVAFAEAQPAEPAAPAETQSVDSIASADDAGQASSD